MARWKKIWATREERDAYDRQIRATIERLRAVAEKAQTDLDAKKRAQDRPTEA